MLKFMIIVVLLVVMAPVPMWLIVLSASAVVIDFILF